MDVKFEDLHGRGGQWLRVINSETGETVGEIMQVMASLNQITGWTFVHPSDKPTTMHRTYKTWRDAVAALLKAGAKCHA